MSLLSRRGLLAIVAVLDVALHARERPVAAKSLAERHQLPARHLEPVLQSLVHQGILKGIRGPRGGYELARERRRISIDDILRAVSPLEEDEEFAVSNALQAIVMPAIAEAELAFSAALRRVTIADMAERAESVEKDPAGESDHKPNFAI